MKQNDKLIAQAKNSPLRMYGLSSAIYYQNVGPWVIIFKYEKSRTVNGSAAMTYTTGLKEQTCFWNSIAMYTMYEDFLIWNSCFEIYFMHNI